MRLHRPFPGGGSRHPGRFPQSGRKVFCADGHLCGRFTSILILQQLDIANFKNLRSLRLEGGGGFHFISGDNGAGKTNLLDCIYYLGITKSFAQQSEKELVSEGAGYFRLDAVFTEEDTQDQLVVKFQPPQTRSWSWNGRKYGRLLEHIGKIPVVLLAPEDVYQLIHAADARRKYLNQILVQTDRDYLEHLLAYNKLLKHRNAALRQMHLSGRADHQMLDALDHGLCQHASLLFEKRRDLSQLLEPLVCRYIDSISHSSQDAGLRYVSDAEADFPSRLLENRSRDLATMRTNSGIHKDRLDCLMEGRPIGQRGSQGQCKTFVAALKLAQFTCMNLAMGSSPIVLLDDIFAKLDANRVLQFAQLLESEGVGQCFITDTHRERVKRVGEMLGQQVKFHELEKGAWIHQQDA
ncbi:MAG: DNA replication and repair protein RecF [Saprospiraceae bacterium]|nr:DNA replication and repair protein RecF [Saprospiraceae bacterium]